MAHASLFETAGHWAVDRHLIPASAMQGYGAAWDDNFWRIAPCVGIYVLVSLYWSANANDKKATERSEPRWSTSLHRLMVNLGVLFLIVPIPGLFGRFLPDDRLWAYAGWIVSALGALFGVWARYTLGRNWSSEVRVAEGHELVRAGPYRFVRHPIYTGFFVLYLGMVLASGRPNALIGFALIALTYWRKIGLEEKLMADTFGEAFQDYRRHSKALIPLLL